MGEPVKIVDLARNLIRLSGKTEDEIGIKFSGIRPGEKLYEELLNDNEIHSKQVYEKIYRGKTTIPPKEELDRTINYLKFHHSEIKETLIRLANRKC